MIQLVSWTRVHQTFDYLLDERLLGNECNSMRWNSTVGHNITSEATFTDVDGT